jgi:hypothetical protein
MATKHLRLSGKQKNGYYATYWRDDRGKRHSRGFGPNRNIAANRFNAFHTLWKSDPRVRNPWMEGPLTVRVAWLKYKDYADGYYKRPDGTSTGEAASIARAFAPVLELFGDMPVQEFRPLALKEVRVRMLQAGLARRLINSRVCKIRQVFKWFGEEELVI